jgi:hypothetical protein
MPERRIQPRFEVCLDVRWQASASHNLRVADFSQGGCYVDTILDVTKGETLSFRILMPQGGWFEVQGVVAHHSPRLGFGVRFVNLSEEQHDRIRMLIEQVSPSEKPQGESAWHLETIDISCHEVM